MKQPEEGKQAYFPQDAGAILVLLVLSYHSATQAISYYTSKPGSKQEEQNVKQKKGNTLV